MSPIRVLIVEDEAEARRGLRRLLAADDEVEVVGESASGEEACEALRTLRPDLAFLDIRLPDMDAFEVLAALAPAELPVVVFVTAFDRYTLAAFEVHAVDYLLKPFTDGRFSQALARAKEHCRQRQAAAFRERLLTFLSERPGDGRGSPATAGDAEKPPAEPFLRRLAVGPRDDVRFVDVATVRWIEADAYRVRVHCGRGSFRLRGNIGSFEKRLDPAEFFRVSRSAIVNLAHVRGLRTLFHDRTLAVLSDGTEVEVSRGRRSALLALLERTGP